MKMLTHVFWSQPYRPLFLLVGLYAVFGMLGWTFFFTGLWLPGSFTQSAISPTLWHAHEMIFGFAGAAIGGFLLTAVPNWTGVRSIAPNQLFILATLWLLGRVGVWSPVASEFISIVSALADIGFFLGLCLWVSHAISASKNKRNFGFIALLLFLTLLNTVFHFGSEVFSSAPSFTIYAGLSMVMIIINIIAGRIIPMFSANWVRQNVPQYSHRQRQKPWLDNTSHVMLITFLVVMNILKIPLLTAIVGVAAAATLYYRWWLWRGWHTRTEPLLWILHIGYFWLPTGILLTALAPVLDFSTSAGIHALTTGAIGTLILAVTSRVALGHSGRALTSRPALTAAYILLTCAAILRVAVALSLFPAFGLHLAATLWMLAFGIFTITYWPILTQPRI